MRAGGSPAVDQMEIGSNQDAAESVSSDGGQLGRLQWEAKDGVGGLRLVCWKAETA